jgi:hypothetical protein
LGSGDVAKFINLSVGDSLGGASVLLPSVALFLAVIHRIALAQQVARSGELTRRI